MITIELEKVPDDQLKAHHEFMDDAVIKIEKSSRLALAIWSEVLKELDRRGLIKLLAGTYDDVGNVHFQRNW